MSMKPLHPMEPIEPGKLERLKRNYLVQAWLVLMLALFFGAALAGVHLELGPKIAANKTNETYVKIPEIILGSKLAEELSQQGETLIVEPHTVSVEKEQRGIVYTIYEASYPDGKLAGWVAKSSGQGYADKIELLIGFSPSVDTLTGIFILDQKETPGLGNKIITLDWRQQFSNLKTLQPIEVTKGGGSDPNQVDAITGATISSRSVTRIVNNAVADLRGPLTAMANARGK